MCKKRGEMRKYTVTVALNVRDVVGKEKQVTCV